jgi:hypothetical protein
LSFGDPNGFGREKFPVFSRFHGNSGAFADGYVNRGGPGPVDPGKGSAPVDRAGRFPLGSAQREGIGQ